MTTAITRNEIAATASMYSIVFMCSPFFLCFKSVARKHRSSAAAGDDCRRLAGRFWIWACARIVVSSRSGNRTRLASDFQSHIRSADAQDVFGESLNAAGVIQIFEIGEQVVDKLRLKNRGISEIKKIARRNSLASSSGFEITVPGRQKLPIGKYPACGSAYLI
jgi:hypothetical protein